MINLTVVIDNEEALRKFRELQKVAKNITSSVVTDSDRMDAAMRRFATTLGQIGVGVSLAGLVRQIATTRGEFQQLEVAFTTLLQNKEKADALMRQMVDLSAKTPFDLQGVANGARQLLAYGFAAEDITDTLTRLGNVAAGLGLPLERLTYLYGTTAVQGRVFARDMLQFTGSGIPVLQELAKMYGKTTEEINAMVSAGKIGFEDVKKVIENMTNAGGQFYNLMENQSKTITGLISNLGDAIDTMFNDIGKSQEGVISSVLQGTISLVENYQKVLDILIPLVAAYGAYKAALITTAALQKTAVTASSIKAFFDLAKGITTAKDAQLLFNMAVKANPLGLALSLLAAIGTAIYRYAKGTKEAAHAVGEHEQAIINEGKQINELVRKYNQANTSQSERKDILKQLKSIQPDIVNGISSEAKATKTLTDNLVAYNQEQIKRIVLSRKQDALAEVAEKYNNAQVNVQSHELELMEQIEEIQSRINSGQFDILNIRNQRIAPSEDAIKGYARHVSEIMASDLPLSEKATTLMNLYDPRFGRLDLGKERRELQDSLREIEGLKEKSAAAKIEYDTAVQDVEDSAKRLGLSLSDAATTATESTVEQITTAADNLKAAQEAYNKAKAEWQNAIKEGADISIVKEKKTAADTAEKALKEAKEAAGVDDKTIRTISNGQEKLSDIISAGELALQQSRIDLMKDGLAKELAQIDLNTKRKVQAIEDERKKELEARELEPTGKLPDDREAKYTQRTANAQKEGDEESIAAKLKYAKEIDAIFKQITDSSFTEEERRVQGIKDKYAELREWIKKALAGGTITQEQAYTFGIKIDQAETADTLRGIIDAYGAAEDKITKIQQEAESARKTAREQGREDLISKIDKQEQEDIGAVKAEELMKTDDWINLFQNLDALSSKEIRRIIDNINEQLKNANLDPINLQAIINQLDQAQQTAISKDPFGGTIASITKYKKSLEEAKTAWEAYAKAIGTADESEAYTKATKAQTKADNDRIQAWQSAQKAAADTANALASVSGALEQMGVEVPAEVEGLMGALNSFASIDITRPFSIVTGVIGGLASLVGGIFGGRNQRAEKRIKRLQEQVEVLEKSYDKLGDAVEKAYSKDAKGLIEDQNKLLEQQKVLIQQQIKEEQSKKNSDKDRIKEWQEQLEEIDKKIADNKEKAIDAIFGEDLKSAIDNFAKAYADAWANGEDRAKSAKDVVRNMMRQMVTESIKSAIQSSEAMKKIREKLTEFYEDNVLSEWEQDYIYKMAEELQQELDSQFGWSDSLMTDKGAEAQTATARGFQAMSQETGDELNGRFTAIQGDVHDIKAFVIEQTNNGAMLLYETMNIRDIMIQLNGNVADIRTYTKVLPSMSETLVSMNRKLDNL